MAYSETITSVSETNQGTDQRHFIFLKLTVLSICPKLSCVLFSLMSYKRRGRKGRLFIKVQKSREMRSAVHKTSYAELSVLLSQGWRIGMIVAVYVDCAL